MSPVFSGPGKAVSPAMRGRAPRRHIWRKWPILVITATLAWVLDLVTKNLAEQHLTIGETIRVLPFLSLQRTGNTGVAFGLLGGKGPLILAANIVALLVVLLYVWMEKRPYLAGIAGGLIVGGSLGNLYQRLSVDGRVTDFLKFPYWPNFNLADVFIVVGIVVVFLGLMWEAVRLWRGGASARPSS